MGFEGMSFGSNTSKRELVPESSEGKVFHDFNGTQIKDLESGPLNIPGFGGVENPALALLPSEVVEDMKIYAENPKMEIGERIKLSNRIKEAVMTAWNEYLDREDIAA